MIDTKEIKLSTEAADAPGFSAMTDNYQNAVIADRNPVNPYIPFLTQI